MNIKPDGVTDPVPKSLIQLGDQMTCLPTDKEEKAKKAKDSMQELCGFCSGGDLPCDKLVSRCVCGESCAKLSKDTASEECKNAIEKWWEMYDGPDVHKRCDQGGENSANYKSVKAVFFTMYPDNEHEVLVAGISTYVAIKDRGCCDQLDYLEFQCTDIVVSSNS